MVSCVGLRLAATRILIGALALTAPIASAGEPYGRVLLQAEVLEEGPRHVVRLSVRSLVSLDDAELTITTPADLTVRAVAPSWDEKFRAAPAREQRRAVRAELDRLDAAKPLSLDLEVVIPPGGGGIVAFEVEGRDGSGRRVHEALGLSARDGAPPGRQRLGAVEFPAAILSSEEPR